MNLLTKKRNILNSHLKTEFKVTQADVDVFRKLNIFTETLDNNNLDYLIYVRDESLKNNDFEHMYENKWGLSTIMPDVTTIISETYTSKQLEKLIEEKLYPKSQEEILTEKEKYGLLTSGIYKDKKVEELNKPHHLFYLEFLISDKNMYRHKFNPRKIQLIEEHLYNHNEIINQYTNDEKQLISKIAKMLESDDNINESSKINLFCSSPVYEKYNFKYYCMSGDGMDIYNSLDVIHDEFTSDYDGTPFLVGYEIDGRVAKHMMQIFIDKHDRLKSIIIKDKTSEMLINEIIRLTKEGTYK